MPQSFPPLNRNEWGLKPIELDEFMGFYFVKFKSSNYPKASEILKRHKETFDQYQTPKVNVSW